MPDAMQASFGGQPPRGDLRSAVMQQQLQHGGTLVEVANHAPVYAQGDPARHIYQVKEGCVCICNYEEEGRRLIHAFHLPGDVFGFEANDHHKNSAEAICPARLPCCEARKLTQAWDENPSVALLSGNGAPHNRTECWNASPISPISTGSGGFCSSLPILLAGPATPGAAN